MPSYFLWMLELESCLGFSSVLKTKSKEIRELVPAHEASQGQYVQMGKMRKPLKFFLSFDSFYAH